MTDLASPSRPRFEHRTDLGATLGLAVTRPRLSWTVPTAPADYTQTAYELEISRESGTATWTVETSEQILVPWIGTDLTSRECVVVRVRVRGTTWSPWSEAAIGEAGLFNAEDWSARFVTPVGIAGLHQPAPQVRGRLNIPGPVLKARLFATAHGVYTASLNGRPIDDTVLAPGWTAYQDRLRYRVYDVTAQVTEGENLLDVTLGNGWWRGRFGFLGERAIYGNRIALLAQMEVTTADGAVHTLSSDDGWRARATGILMDDIYDGQTTDLRGQVDAAYAVPVETTDADLSTLVGEDGPPMRVIESLPARDVWTSDSGTTLIDFGQNVVGWVRVHARDTRAGNEVTIRHAEVLEAGRLGTGPLRSARATDTYYLAGGPSETLEPSLTFHGFRYAEITGITGIRADDIEAVVIGTDLRRTGWFTSSNDLLNRFHDNVVWGMRGNFLDVPTDCPQRDERLGWTGDIQVFAPTATYLFDTAGFLTSWLADLAFEQHTDGSVPHVIPDILRTTLTSAPAAAWGDAAVIVPWTLWQRFGDKGILQRQLPSMRAWVDKVASLAGVDGVWAGGFQYGDWLDPTAPADDPAAAKADPDVIATAHWARSARIVSDAAMVLGDTETAATYADMAERARSGFVAAFVTPNGRVLSDAQTVYAMALEWDLLVTAEQRTAAGARLADLVRAGAFRIATGFVGTPLICDALTNAGYPELAFRLLLQTESPSWLYPVTMGATTVWERWDSLLPDGTINPSGMTSFNHYALGSVIDWVHRRIAGLAPAAPGYRTIDIRPLPPRSMRSASARHRTPFGDATVSWVRTDGRFTLEIDIPVGTAANVELPWNAGARTVGHGQHRWVVEEPLPESTPIITIRDVIDDEALWQQLSNASQKTGIATSDQRVAQLASAHFDRPAETLTDGVWTKSWPSATSVSAIATAIQQRARSLPDEPAHKLPPKGTS